MCHTSPSRLLPSHVSPVFAVPAHSLRHHVPVHLLAELSRPKCAELRTCIEKFGHLATSDANTPAGDSESNRVAEDVERNWKTPKKAAGDRSACKRDHKEGPLKQVSGCEANLWCVWCGREDGEEGVWCVVCGGGAVRCVVLGCVACSQRRVVWGTADTAHFWPTHVRGRSITNVISIWPKLGKSHDGFADTMLAMCTARRRPGTSTVETSFGRCRCASQLVCPSESRQMPCVQPF